MNRFVALIGTGCEKFAMPNQRRKTMGSANAQGKHWPASAASNLRRTSSKKPSRQPVSAQFIDQQVVKHAAECVEELLENIRTDQGTPWFLILERKMNKLVKAIQ